MELHKPNSKVLRVDHAIVKKKKRVILHSGSDVMVEHVSLQKISLLLKIKLFPIIPLNEHMYLAFSFVFVFFFFFKMRSSTEGEMLMSDEIKFPCRAFGEKTMQAYLFLGFCFSLTIKCNIYFISSLRQCFSNFFSAAKIFPSKILDKSSNIQYSSNIQNR